MIGFGYSYFSLVHLSSIEGRLLICQVYINIQCRPSENVSSVSISSLCFPFVDLKIRKKYFRTCVLGFQFQSSAQVDLATSSNMVFKSRNHTGDSMESHSEQSGKICRLLHPAPRPVEKVTLPHSSPWFCPRTNKIERLCKNGWFLPAKTIAGSRENQANDHILLKLFPH